MPITADQPQRNKPKKKGGNIGTVVFLLFVLWRVFGSNLNGWLRRVRMPSGTSVGSTQILLLGAAAVAVFVVVFIIKQAVNRRGQSDQMLPLPQNMSPTPNAAGTAARAPFTTNTPASSTAPSTLPKPRQVSNYQQSNAFNPKAPSYEPALRANVILAAIVFGGLLFGGLFLLNLI